MGPSLLIASPQLKDPFFERSLVLLWHHDDEGAIGVVVNRQVDHRLEDVLVLDDDDLAASAGIESRVMWGGPVETEAGTVVALGQVDPEEGWQVGSVGVTRSQDALTRLLRSRAPMMLCLGYAGWGPGQLDREIESGGWLWTDVDPDIVFNAPIDDRYELALATLGLTPTTVWMQPLSD